MEVKFDVIIVGGGAAGLMAAIRLSSQKPELSVAILDGARKLGAKILISGGGRCNVTNRCVTADDFNGGSRNVVKRVLHHFPATATVDFFESLGVELHEEPLGKLFPNSNKARTLLDALVSQTQRNRVEIMLEQRVTSIETAGDSFRLSTTTDTFQCRRVVLATGGKSVPKTGSDGFGFELASKLGHTIKPTFPALDPLLLDGDFHTQLSGISQNVELTLYTQGQKPVSFEGSMLWTHFGISGPVALDLSRHWHAASLESMSPVVRCNFMPSQNFQTVEKFLVADAINRVTSVRKQLATSLPLRFVDAMFHESGISADVTFANLPKQQRRTLVHQLVERELPVTGSRGFGYAEATAGGVPLNEVNPSTMESRCCPGLFLTGEILDVDGRLGGFNFQWAWSSAVVAADGIAKTITAT